MTEQLDPWWPPKWRAPSKDLPIGTPGRSFYPSFPDALVKLPSRGDPVHICDFRGGTRGRFRVDKSESSNAVLGYYETELELRAALLTLAYPDP